MTPKTKSGFTLLELLIALAIAAAVFAIVVPGASRPNSSAQVASSARVVANALRHSRMRAIEFNRPEALVVDTQNAVYRDTGGHRLPAGLRIGLYTASDAVSAASVGSIRFYPDGSSSGGGILLANEQASYDVLVDWLTGGISIHERATTNR